ncbi:GLPGLI family protein [Empedobacter stercoris]|uniref:GLPGLI family protein n=1 Tax=Empedobacter stercoris TaxID=1628248 RepID=A0ABX1WNB9_9FLAO|nr:GLPGLI family protein [Empedobacter stercoris]NOJ76193.1 GLPGLI family protein [Empedobacter stercoris]
MKYFLLILCPFIAFAQEKFKVEYEVRNHVTISNTTPEKAKKLEEAFSKPKFYELFVDKDKCLSKELQRIDNSQGSRMTIFTVEGDVVDKQTYLDFNSNEKIIEKSVDGKAYLVSDIIENNDWKLTKETKIINGYKVRKAILNNDIHLVEAWFSKDIKSKCGPNKYNNLPGLILEVKSTVIEKPTTFTTIKLEHIRQDDKISIQKPNKGIQMNDNEFSDFTTEYYRKIDQKFKESQKQGVDKT